MRLLIRRGDSSWTEPEISGHKSEDDLQQLLATSPDLLPGDETGLPMAVARELRVATGRIDIVAVDVEANSPSANASSQRTPVRDEKWSVNCLNTRARSEE